MVRRFETTLQRRCLILDVTKLVYQTSQQSQEEMKISGAHVSAARDLLKITQEELAALTGVSRLTILRFEAGEGEPQRANLEKIQTELERRGIEFTNGDGIGVRLNFVKAAEFTRTATRNEPNL